MGSAHWAHSTLHFSNSSPPLSPILSTPSPLPYPILPSPPSPFQVIDRILYKLDELVRPFVHKILVVIEPLLIDEDYYARVEGREIISNLSKVRAGR